MSTIKWSTSREKGRRGAETATSPLLLFASLKEKQVLHLVILPKARVPFRPALRGLPFQHGMQGIQKAYTRTLHLTVPYRPKQNCDGSVHPKAPFETASIYFLMVKLE